MSQGAARLVDDNRAQLAHVKGVIDGLRRIAAYGGLPEVGSPGGRAPWAGLGRALVRSQHRAEGRLATGSLPAKLSALRGAESLVRPCQGSSAAGLEAPAAARRCAPLPVGAPNPAPLNSHDCAVLCMHAQSYVGKLATATDVPSLKCQAFFGGSGGSGGGNWVRARFRAGCRPV